MKGEGQSLVRLPFPFKCFQFRRGLKALIPVLVKTPFPGSLFSAAPISIETCRRFPTPPTHLRLSLFDGLLASSWVRVTIRLEAKGYWTGYCEGADIWGMFEASAWVLAIRRGIYSRFVHQACALGVVLL